MEEHRNSIFADRVKDWVRKIEALKDAGMNVAYDVYFSGSDYYSSIEFAFDVDCQNIIKIKFDNSEIENKEKSKEIVEAMNKADEALQEIYSSWRKHYAEEIQKARILAKAFIEQ